MNLCQPILIIFSSFICSKAKHLAITGTCFVGQMPFLMPDQVSNYWTELKALVHTMHIIDRPHLFLINCWTLREGALLPLCWICSTLLTQWYYYNRFTTLCPGLPLWGGTRRITILDFAEADMMGYQWHQLNHMQAICTSLWQKIQRHHLISQIFTGWMFFLTPNQQRQSTESQW